MKYLSFLLLIFACHSAFCQDGNLPLDENKQVFYSDRGNLTKTRAEIFKSAQNWVSKTFGNYENAVTLQDMQAGKLVINSYVPVIHSLYDHIRFDLTIDCNDNQYQAKISSLDGISQIRSPVRISSKENDLVLTKSMIMKSETNRKKRAEAEQEWKEAVANNEEVNNAMFRVLASLKESM